LIKINSPNNCINERKYIYEYIFENQFNLKTSVEYGDYRCVEIINTLNNTTLCIPDIFFKNIESTWLEEYKFKKIIIQNWVLKNQEFKVPIPFYEIIKTNDFINIISIDFFGFIFFKLSQYEECILNEYDMHERFNTKKSILANFSNIPLVDIYLEKLKIEINNHLKTNIEITNNFILNITCDLDFALYLDKNALRNARKLIKSLSFKYNIQDKRHIIVDMYNLYLRHDSKYVDRFNNGISFIKRLAHKLNSTCKFYVIPLKTSTYDFQTLEDSRVLKLIRALMDEGNEIGMHPGYETYKSNENMMNSVIHFKKLVNSKNLDVRQHYLRWSQRKTVGILDKLGVSSDSTIGYSSDFGFRCGTAKSFNLYNLDCRYPTKVKEVPIIFMDTALFNSKNNIEQDLLNIKFIKDMCKLFGGNFNCVLHNHNYDNEYNRSLIHKVFYL
jgi:hypothetical protein